MANSSFLRSLISNPRKITPDFLLKPSQFLITRQFTSNPSDPIAKPRSDPTQITTFDLFTGKPIDPKPMSQKNKVEEFFEVRTEGLFVSAGKVFEKMAKRLRPFHNNRNFTHEAMERSKGRDRMPDVVAHIAVLEAYANAGQTDNNAHRVYLKMVGAGAVNEHTYNMLIKLLASTGSGDWMMIRQAQKYLIEMLEKGMMPDVATSVAIFKALAKEERVREGKEFLEDIKRRGFVVNKKVFKEVVKGRGGALKVLKGKQGNVVRNVLEMMFDEKLRN